jgi:hypothetical protein
MADIIGAPFDDYVHDQIEIRQKSLGKSQKTADDLVVFNSSTPWIRLSSSVEIGADRAKTLATNLGINQSEVVGRNLAKNLVLFAGTSDGADLSNRKGGVGYGLKSSYGFLSSPKQGYRPMPGVTGISASYKNNGTLKQAQVNLTCFTREQFEAIEAIYLRLGYTMLLEWGHSLYFDNKGKKQNMSSLEVPNILFKEKLPPEVNTNKEIKALEKRELAAVEKARKANPNITSKELEDIANSTFNSGLGDINSRLKEEQLKKNYSRRLRVAIEENKRKTGGNYDAMLAKVQNFSWSLNDDLSYNITLDLISVGDIIDSLKMNFGGTQLTNTKANNVITGEGLRNFTNIRLQSGTSAFNSFLYELTQLLEEQKVKEALSSATQAAIENVNRAISLEPLLDSIKKEYAKAIENYKKLRITPLQKIRGILLANPNLPTRNIGLYIIYQFQGSLGAIKEEVNKLSDGYDTVFSMFLSEDGIKKQLVNGVGLDIETLSQTTTSGYKIVEAPEGAVFTGASNFYTGVLEEIPKLNEIEIFFAGLKVNATESKNFQLINFLDKNKSKAIEVIKRLIAEREFDEEGDFELDEYK